MKGRKAKVGEWLVNKTIYRNRGKWFHVRYFRVCRRRPDVYIVLFGTFWDNTDEQLLPLTKEEYDSLHITKRCQRHWDLLTIG